MIHKSYHETCPFHEVARTFMKTVVLEHPGSFTLEDRPLPDFSQPSETLVQVRRIGVCGTDLHAFKGDQPFFSYPRVLGHELGVEVLEVGDSSAHVGVGDYCAVEPYYNCGVCSACRIGKTNCCEQLSVLGVHEDGGMCEHVVIPTHKLHPSSILPLEHLALVEMLTIGAHAVRRAQIQAQHRVAVIGAGPIGLGAIQFSRLAGAEPVVLEIDERRRAFCADFLGIENPINPLETPVDKLKDHFGGDLPDIVLDATGNPTSMHNAFDYVSAAGTLVFIGLFVGDISFHDPEFHRRELTLMSSRNATASDFSYVIRMLERGRINLNPWITHRTELGFVTDEFASWLDRDQGVIKAMIDID